jgi:methionyl-tRNA formyltransferase
MRFAITATDRYLGVFQALVEAGWQPVKLFTAPVDDRLFHNKATIDFAYRLGIPVQLSPIGRRDFEDLAELGCEALMVASYNHRIGDWTPYLRYAVNFHPSPLPLGRGPYPLVRAVRDRHTAWGVTCHKLSAEFDAGDILACERFALSGAECHDSIDLKIQMASRRLASRIAGGFESLWDTAQPQTGGEYWKFWTDDDRTLDFGGSVENILLQIRSFGGHETIAHVNGFRLRVRRAIGWAEPHFDVPGSIVHTCSNTVVIAARNGYIGLTDWTPDGVSQHAAQRQTPPVEAVHPPGTRQDEESAAIAL